MRTVKILGIGPREFVGASRVLVELARLGMSDFAWLDEVSLPVKDYDICILAAWHPSYNMLLDQLKAQIFVLWTSPFLQSELTNIEIQYLDNILRNDQIEKVWIGDKTCAKVLDDNPKTFYCPYPINTDYLDPYYVADNVKCDFIGMFLPFRNPQKNIITQLGAIKLLQKDYPEFKLMTNGMTSTQQRFAKTLGINYQDQGWMPEKTYFALIQDCKLICHVTLSESFAYSVFDAMYLRTPVMVSKTIAENFNFVNGNNILTVKNPDNPVEIYEKLTHIISLSDYEFHLLSESTQIHAKTHAKHQNFKLKDTLNSIIGEFENGSKFG